MDEDVNRTEEVIKRGETQISFRFKRTNNGLLIITKTHPMMEQTLRSWGSGEKIAVGTLNRNWAVMPRQKTFMAWDLSREHPVQFPLNESGGSYTISAPGAPIIDPFQQGTPQQINLSMLRLVGVSEANGVGFTIKGVYSKEAVKKIAEQIVSASRRFVIDFMLPVDLSVVVSTQEVRKEGF